MPPNPRWVATPRGGLERRPIIEQALQDFVKSAIRPRAMKELAWVHLVIKRNAGDAELFFASTSGNAQGARFLFRAHFVELEVKYRRPDGAYELRIK